MCPEPGSSFAAFLRSLLLTEPEQWNADPTAPRGLAGGAARDPLASGPPQACCPHSTPQFKKQGERVLLQRALGGDGKEKVSITYLTGCSLALRAIWLGLRSI